MNNRLEIYQNNTKEIVVAVIGLSDLTPYTPYLSVKRKATDASTILFKQGVVSDPSGTFTFSLTATDTSLAARDYVYDVVAEGNGNHITLAKDVLSILEGVYE